MTTNDQMTPEVDEVWRQFFGQSYSDMQEPVALRGVRLKLAPGGGLTVAHPDARGDKIIVVQQVPATVSTADVLRRMGRVTVLRQPSADYGGSRVIHYDEISEGVILR